MKGLFRERGIVIRVFLLLIMVLPEPEDKKKKNVDVLFIIIRGLKSIYNHENHPVAKTAPAIVPVLILCTI